MTVPGPTYKFTFPASCLFIMELPVLHYLTNYQHHSVTYLTTFPERLKRMTQTMIALVIVVTFNQHSFLFIRQYQCK